jgi:thiamine-phosphate pyrophosphorylase
MPTPRTRTDARASRAARISGLYAITPELDDTQRLVRLARAAIDGGARVLQLRHKSAVPGLRQEQARALAELCVARGVLFIVNDDAALAAAVDADGVHLGEDDGDIDAARALLGPDRLIGVSCYGDVARGRAMAAAGADYLAFGSLFPSTVKPGARRASLSQLGEARTLGLPVVGIGGIDAYNARSVVEAGADAVAVIADLFGDAHGTRDAENVRRAAERIARAVAPTLAARAAAPMLERR